MFTLKVFFTSGLIKHPFGSREKLIGNAACSIELDIPRLEAYLSHELPS